MTKIVIADDQALFREGLRTLLSIRPDMDVVGEAANGDEAVALVEALRPNVVLMDLRMPKVDGIQATARIRKRWPEIPVLVLTTFDDDANLFGALRAGAAGYLLKDVSSETLIAASSGCDPGRVVPAEHRHRPRRRRVRAVDGVRRTQGRSAGAAALAAGTRNRVAARQRRLEQGDCRSAQSRRRHGQEPRDKYSHQARRAGPHTGGHPRPSAWHCLMGC
jgi:DNA-binding NarL/FixJ family response regulator